MGLSQSAVESFSIRIRANRAFVGSDVVINKLVEMMGPGGVGKTTTYRAMVDRLPGPWVAHDSRDFKNKVLRTDGPAEDFRVKLVRRAARDIEARNISELEKLDLLSFKVRMARSDALSFHAPEDWIFCEQGILQNFTGEVDHATDPLFRKVMMRRAVIALLARRPNVVVDNIRSRTVEGGHTLQAHARASDEELERIIISHTRRFKRLIARMDREGVPNLCVYIEDGLVKNCTEIEEFLRCLADNYSGRQVS